MANEIAPHQAPQAESSRTVVLFDRSNAMCLLNLVSDEMAKRIEEAAQKLPEYFTMDETILLKTMKSENQTPTAVDNRLKLKFWVEYDRIANHQGTQKMVMKNISAGVCTEDYFYQHYIKSPSKMAWLVCPPTGYLAKTKEALDFAIDQLRDFLSVHTGQYDKNFVQINSLKLQIAKMLDDRVRGAVVQRVEQKSVQVNVNATASEINQITGTMTMEEIDKNLAALKSTYGEKTPKSPKTNTTNQDAIVVESHHVPDNK